MADVKDILGMARSGPAPAEEAPKPVPAKKEKMKRPEGMSREAFALLQGGSHPILPSQLVSSLKKKDVPAKPKPSTKGIVTFQYRPFKNQARTDGLELCHWVKCHKGANGVIKEPEEDYPSAKYNKKIQLYKYNDEEYDSLIRPESGNWTRQETDYLYDLCEMFDLRWHVIFDRYEYAPPGGGPPPPERSLEDLKERYYGVARRLLVSRQGREAHVANATLVKHPFNKLVEQERKRALTLLLARTPQQITEDHAILAEARAIEEKRKAEANAARRAAATTAATAPPPAAAAAPPRTTSPSQPGRPPSQPGAAPGAMPGALAPGPAGLGGPMGQAPMSQPRSLSPTPSAMGGDARHPVDFGSAVPAGTPSLFDADVRPYKPKPGVYLRGAHTQSMAAQQAAAMAGGPRAFKAVEATLAELNCPSALYGPRVMTRATSGAWLALRAEVIALHETRRNLANRMNADERVAKRPEKRRRP